MRCQAPGSAWREPVAPRGLAWPAACLRSAPPSSLAWWRVPARASGCSVPSSSGCGGAADPRRAGSRRSAAQIEAKKGRERVLTTTIAGYTSRIDSCRATSPALQERQTRIQADLDAKRAELARIQDELREERIRLPAARAARRGARRAQRAPRRALQGRQARRRHGDPRVRRLRRPARADGVHPARLPAGRAHHRPRPARQGGGDRDGQARSTGSRQRQREVTAIVARRDRRSPTSRAAWSTGAQQYADVRADKHERARLDARRPPRRSRATSRALESEQAQIQARLAGGPGGPAPARSARAPGS